MKKTVIFISIVSVIVMVAIVLNGSLMKNSLNTNNQNGTGNTISLGACGDGACDRMEWCNKCPEDCGCKNNEICDNSIGVCKRVFCGDGICEEREKENCCKDCGCENEGYICNAVKNVCIKKIILTGEESENILKKYLSYRLVEVIDGVYNSSPVKNFRFYCSTTSNISRCGVDVFVTDAGVIIKELVY